MAEGPAIDGWLPDPRAMLGWYAVPVETRVGPQEWSLGIQQDIPFPTKLTLKSDIAEVEARRALVVYERTVRDVLTDVVRTAWELVYLDQAERISGEVARLLDRYVAAAGGEPSDSPLSELFRAETQRAQLENDRILLMELRAAEAERLRSLLALPPGTPIGTPQASSIPALSLGYEEVLAVASAESQELREAGLASEAAVLGSDLADQRIGVCRAAADLRVQVGVPARHNDGLD
jgi:outer membrane protein TolC